MPLLLFKAGFLRVCAPTQALQIDRLISVVSPHRLITECISLKGRVPRPPRKTLIIVRTLRVSLDTVPCLTKLLLLITLIRAVCHPITHTIVTQ